MTLIVEFQADPEAALGVIRNAGAWLWDTGRTTSQWWAATSLTSEAMFKRTDPSTLFAGRVDGEPAVAAVLTEIDVFDDWKVYDEGNQPKSLYVHWLAVHRDFAGHRLAARMLGFALERASQLEVRYLRLNTDANNPTLCALYRSNGFELVKAEPTQERLNALFQRPV